MTPPTRRGHGSSRQNTRLVQRPVTFADQECVPDGNQEDEMTTRLHPLPLQQESARSAELNPHGLYRAGGVGALMMGLLLIVEVIAYLATSAPSLADAGRWFALFQNHRLVGLVDFGLLELLGLTLFVPMFLALYAALHGADESAVAIATALALLGIAANFATSKLFSLLALSDLYAAATTETLKAQFLAAGQAALAVGAQGGIGGSVEGGIPLASAGLILSAVMVRSHLLGRAAGYAGLLANGLGFAMVLRAAAGPVLAGNPFFGAFFLLSVIWYVLIARGLLQLGRGVSRREGADR